MSRWANVAGRSIAGRLIRALPPDLCYSLAIRMVDRLSADQSRYLMEQVATIHRAHLQRDLKDATGGIVQAGPFRGLRLPETSSWGDGDYVPKLLGFYESELHAILDGAIRAYERVIDVGCAEGYYAIGFALANPRCEVLAFDASPDAATVCGLSAKANGVADRVTIGGDLDPAALEDLLAARTRTLLFMDCEGCEFDLLNPDVVPALSHTDFVAECHDFAVPGMATVLEGRFRQTHDVARIMEAGRNPNQSEHLRDRNSLVRWLAVNERRPQTMEWLHGQARR